jgi:hypothetical protein
MISNCAQLLSESLAQCLIRVVSCLPVLLSRIIKNTLFFCFLGYLTSVWGDDTLANAGPVPGPIPLPSADPDHVSTLVAHLSPALDVPFEALRTTLTIRTVPITQPPMKVLDASSELIGVSTNITLHLPLAS